MALFYAIDATAGRFSSDGFYFSYIFGHIFFAQILAIVPTTIYVALTHKKELRKWLLYLAATSLLIALSFINYYTHHSAPSIESNYKTDVSYTCIYGEMYSGT